MARKNRWLIALSAVAIHLSIGSAYAYSVYKGPLGDLHGWSSTQTSLAFTIAIFFLGASAAVFGRWIERMGPRRAALLAAALFAGGLLVAGAGVAAGSLALFYLGYGVIGGMGLGIGYIGPVSTLVSWFPDRRGLATGMAVMGFGAGALLASPVATRLIEAVGVPSTFYTLGAAYFALMVLGGLYIERPPEGWRPVGAKQGTTGAAAPEQRQFTVQEALRTERFWMLWLMMFINISAGILLISVASPLAQEKAGMEAVAAATMVGVMGLFNGGGRIGWSALSDYLGRLNIFKLFFAVQIVAFLLLPRATDALLFQVLLFTVISMYGGGFATVPAFLSDLFGTQRLSSILGLLLTSWSLAGIVGPMAAALSKDLTGSYDAAFHAVLVLLAVALGVSMLLGRRIRQAAALPVAR